MKLDITLRNNNSVKLRWAKWTDEVIVETDNSIILQIDLVDSSYILSLLGYGQNK